MKLSRPYLIAALLLIAALVYAEYRGWSTLSIANASEPIPTSVRDNPGAYRAHYVPTGRYVGGK